MLVMTFWLNHFFYQVDRDETQNRSRHRIISLQSLENLYRLHRFFHIDDFRFQQLKK